MVSVWSKHVIHQYPSLKCLLHVMHGLHQQRCNNIWTVKRELWKTDQSRRPLTSSITSNKGREAEEETSGTHAKHLLRLINHTPKSSEQRACICLPYRSCPVGWWRPAPWRPGAARCRPSLSGAEPIPGRLRRWSQTSWTRGEGAQDRWVDGEWSMRN